MSAKLPKGWIQGDRYWIRHIGNKARISKSLVKTQPVYALWLLKGKHWDLAGTYDSLSDAASAYEYGAQPQRRKA